jgi:hypothetical protein
MELGPPAMDRRRRKGGISFFTLRSRSTRDQAVARLVGLRLWKSPVCVWVSLNTDFPTGEQWFPKGTHNARVYHRVQDYLLHLIYGILLMWQHIYWRKREKKQDSKSYLDSKSTIFEVINSFRLYDRVCIVSALNNLCCLIRMYHQCQISQPWFLA